MTTPAPFPGKDRRTRGGLPGPGPAWRMHLSPSVPLLVAGFLLAGRAEAVAGEATGPAIEEFAEAAAPTSPGFAGFAASGTRGPVTVPAGAAADTLPVEAREPLALSEALERAEASNPALRSARNRLDLTPAERRRAIGLVLPDIRFQLSTGTFWRRTHFALDPLGNPLDNRDTPWVHTSRSTQTVSATMALFDGLQPLRNLRLARLEAEGRDLAFEGERRTLHRTVSSAHLHAAYRALLVDVEEGLLEARRRELELTRNLFHVAGRGELELLGAELAVQRQERALAQARTEGERALLALQRVMGEPGAPTFSVAPELPEPFDPARLDAEEVVRIATRGNLDLRRAEQGVESGERRLDLLRGDRWLPTVTLSAAWGRNRGGPEGRFFGDFSPAGMGDGDVSLFVSFPRLPGFDQFRRGAEVTSAEVSLRNEREALREVRLGIEERVRGLLLDLHQGWARLRVAERGVELADRSLLLTQERYRTAAASFRELEQATDQAAMERRNLSSERYGFAQARIALEELLGSPLDPDGG